MSIWSKLAKGLAIGGGIIGAPFTGGGSLAATIGAIGSAAGSAAAGAAQAKAGNRGTALEAELAQEQLRQSQLRDEADQRATYEQSQRTGLADSMKAAQQAAYIQGRTQDYKPANITIAGRSMPSYGFGPRASTDAERSAAAGVADEAAKRIAAGGSLAPAPVSREQFRFDPKNLKAGGWEKALGILGLAGTAIGASLDKSNPADVDWLENFSKLDPAQQRTVIAALGQGRK